MISRNSLVHTTACGHCHCSGRPAITHPWIKRPPWGLAPAPPLPVPLLCSPDSPTFPPDAWYFQASLQATWPAPALPHLLPLVQEDRTGNRQAAGRGASGTEDVGRPVDIEWDTLQAACVCGAGRSGPFLPSPVAERMGECNTAREGSYDRRHVGSGRGRQVMPTSRRDVRWWGHSRQRRQIIIKCSLCFLIFIFLIFLFPRFLLKIQLLTFLIHYMLVTQSCPTLCNLMDCNPPGSSVHRIFQVRILEWIAIPFSRGCSQTRDETWVSCIAGRFVYHLATIKVL